MFTLAFFKSFYCRQIDVFHELLSIIKKYILSIILQCQCEMEVYCFSFLCCSASNLTLRSWIISLPNVLCLMYLYCSALCFCTFFFEWSSHLDSGRFMNCNRWEKIFFICWYWWWPGGRMYDVIYFNVWSDIICTAAKLLHGTSAFSQKSLFFLKWFAFYKHLPDR